MTYAELVAYIQARIYTNTNNEVTAAKVQEALLACALFTNESIVLNPDDVLSKVDSVFPVDVPMEFYFGAVKAYKVDTSDGNFKLYKTVDDGVTYDLVMEFDITNNKSTNYAYPFNKFYSCLELASTPLALTIGAGATEKITNVTDDALVNTISDGYLAFAADALTVQNLPSGYSAWIRCNALIDYINDSGVNLAPLELIIRSKSFNDKTQDAVNIYPIAYSNVFSVVNTDVIDLSIKNGSGTSNTLSIKRLFADFELIKIFPTP